MISKINKCLFIVLASGFICLSCDGPTGPEGPQGLQGEQGPVGPQGPPGDDGNANVKTFEFTVSAAEWGNNLHYGSNNIFRAFTILEEEVGGIEPVPFFNDGGAIVVYANAHHSGGGSLGSWHNLPYTYQSVNGIGIRILYFFSRGQLAITRTTTGWDANSISEDHLPDTVDFKMVFIENVSQNELADMEVNLDNYSALMSYFGMIVDNQ